MSYTEGTVQQTTADYVEQQLGWEPICAYNNQDFWQDRLLSGGPARRPYE